MAGAERGRRGREAGSPATMWGPTREWVLTGVVRRWGSRGEGGLGWGGGGERKMEERGGFWTRGKLQGLMRKLAGQRRCEEGRLGSGEWGETNGSDIIRARPGEGPEPPDRASLGFP
jgi:hypothetical protein